MPNMKAFERINSAFSLKNFENEHYQSLADLKYLCKTSRSTVADGFALPGVDAEVLVTPDPGD